jgi:glycosyltransferase involved in cell wall biosynthesis
MADVCVVLKKRLKSGYSPIKVYEYMACAKPVIASRVEGLEFIESEGVGRLVEPGDTICFERAMLDLLLDPRKGAHMGEKGIRLVRERFSWSSVTLRIESILKELA